MANAPLHCAYVIHTRPYRESSLLVEFFTREEGRVSCMAKGARAPRKTAATLQSFQQFDIAWRGKTDLKTLITSEAAQHAPVLMGDHLFSGMYLNELLYRLLQPHDAHSALFDHYEQALQQLAQGVMIEPVLRQFEYALLCELGYGFPLAEATDTGLPVAAGRYYVFSPEEGLRQSTVTGVQEESDSPWVFRGDELLALAEGDFSLPAVRRSAKRLMRLALQSHLGGEPLRSRELFF